MEIWKKIFPGFENMKFNVDPSSFMNINQMNKAGNSVAQVSYDAQGKPILPAHNPAGASQGHSPYMVTTGGRRGGGGLSDELAARLAQIRLGSDAPAYRRPVATREGGGGAKNLFAQMAGEISVSIKEAINKIITSAVAEAATTANEGLANLANTQGTIEVSLGEQKYAIEHSIIANLPDMILQKIEGDLQRLDDSVSELIREKHSGEGIGIPPPISLGQ